ncbi:hypothetical protein B4U80_00445, partial [Leptotrombidium deliense]
GRIDHAKNENWAKKALDKTYYFDKAIEKALSMVNPEKTLILVTADHSHTLTINGYQERGSNILGKTFLNYTTILYGNGPGYDRQDSEGLEITDKKYRQKSAAFKESAAHGGEDVPVYATGPGSQFVTGVFDQSFIPYVVSASACIGPFAFFCNSNLKMWTALQLLTLVTIISTISTTKGKITNKGKDKGKSEALLRYYEKIKPSYKEYKEPNTKNPDSQNYKKESIYFIRLIFDYCLNVGDAKYWRYKNKNLLAQKVKILKHLFGNTGLSTKAKNVIFFLGDGMGLSTVTAARLYKGNVEKTDPEAGCLSFEHFPSVSLAKVTRINPYRRHKSKLCIKVNSLNVTVADSAATATSYLCGVKTNQNNIGVSGNVKLNDCEASKIESNRVSSIIRWAQKAEKFTGVVTTTKITDATPAVSYAHSANRAWE